MDTNRNWHSHVNFIAMINQLWSHSRDAYRQGHSHNMLNAPRRAQISPGFNAFGDTFAHSIAQTADLETVTLLLAARTGNLRLDEEAMDLQGKTCGEYFRERMALFGGVKRELEDAFPRLVRKVRDAEGSGDVEMRDEGVIGGLKVDIKENLHVMVEAVDLVTEEGLGGGLVEDA